MSSKSYLIPLAVLALFSTEAIAEDAAGKASYAVCVACHGENGEGNAALNAPRIGGQAEWYVARQLGYFREGVRGGDTKDLYGTQMRPMAMTLPDDAAVKAVSAYVSKLAGGDTPATVEGDAEKGKAKYATCAACHGPNGEGVEALNAPGLAGQHDWYTVRQVMNYKSGLRGTHAKDTYGAQMRPMAMTLATEQDVKDVAAYIATLPK